MQADGFWLAGQKCEGYAPKAVCTPGKGLYKIMGWIFMKDAQVYHGYWSIG